MADCGAMPGDRACSHYGTAPQEPAAVRVRYTRRFIGSAVGVLAWVGLVVVLGVSRGDGARGDGAPSRLQSLVGAARGPDAGVKRLIGDLELSDAAADGASVDADDGDSRLRFTISNEYVRRDGTPQSHRNLVEGHLVLGQRQVHSRPCGRFVELAGQLDLQRGLDGHH